MIKKLVFALLLVVFVSQFALPAVYAMDEPLGECAPGFMLAKAMDHEEHHHRHIGTDADQNGDNYICMRHVTPGGDIHLHVDNPLP